MNRDANVVAIELSVTGHIHNLWVNNAFNGPYTPDELVGLHVDNLLTRPEELKMLSWINKAIHGNEIIRGSITLDMAVAHTLRLAHIFKQDRNRVLALIIKQE